MTGWTLAGKSPFDLLHVFENPRARPIQISPVFKDTETYRITSIVCRARLDVRRGKELRDDWIGDLIFDELGRLAAHFV